MKRRTLFLTRAAWVALAVITSWVPTFAATSEEFTFVYPNGQAEWAAAGDWDGNGLLDAVIVDRVTGTYRLGYQKAGGTHSWTSPRASGVPNVTGFSVGPVIDNAVDGLAFTSEEANRINLIPAASQAQAGIPVPVYIPSVGPNQVVALEIGGGGNTPWHDLFVASAWNGLNPFRVTLVRNSDGASFNTLQDAEATGALERGNRVRIKNGVNPMLAIMERGANDILRVVELTSGLVNPLLALNGLPPGSDYVVGDFDGDGLAQFLVFQPGGSNLWSYAVEEPMAGTFDWGAGMTFPFPEAIASVVTLPGTGEPKLLIVFGDGQHAAAYNFDGVNPPVWIEDFQAPPGQSLLGALAMGDGGLRLLSGSGGRTAQSHQYSYDGDKGTYVLDRVDTLPAVSDLSGQANVFQFQMEPFVSAAPHLLNSLNAGDWSSDFQLAGGPAQVSVVNERYLGSSQGLGNPTPTTLGASHPQTQFGLVNQYLDFVSLFSLAPAQGNEVTEVSAHPPGGLYATSVAVNFTVGSPAFQVLYRLNTAGAWTVYSGKPVQILTNTILQFHARAILGTTQTAIHFESYQFEEGPDTLDSDSDGVLDYVEADQGLDPVHSGRDGDEDGYSDLEELLKGTSPTDPTDVPAGKPGYEQHAAVDFLITPLPLDGGQDAETDSATGTLVRLYNLSGSLLATTNVAQFPEVPLDASALFRDVMIDPDNELLLVATEPHFDVVTPGPDTRIGRELVRLLPTPQVMPIQVEYEFGQHGGVISDEADAWIAAAQAAHAAATPETRFLTVPTHTATVAALLERKLRLILQTDPEAEVTNVTLFPFRTLDAGLPHYGEEVRNVLRHGNALRPAYDVTQMLANLEIFIETPPTPQVEALNAMAHEVYRVSSTLNNDAPGQYRLPLDVLRQFLGGGILDSNYVAGGNFPPALLTDAWDGAQFLLDNLTSRPVTNLTLRVLVDSFTGNCTTLETADEAMASVHLFDLDGARYDFPDTFQLLPGSVVQVTGRPDVSSASCGGFGLEVLSISLNAIPASSDGDGDGNLLVDAWEKQFLGGLGGDPFGDLDGDGYSDLQEMFEGSDPLDGLGVPPVPIAKMELPSLIIETSIGGTVQLEWEWPAAYADKIAVLVWSTSDLGLTPMLQPVTPVPLGGDVFTVTLPNPGTGQHFYSIALQLK